MIDLRSDTVTRPTTAMKQAMFEAEVGDDVMGEDPTANQLEARVADLLGKEAAVFTCTATQANQIAVKIHCSPGDELLINSSGHIGLYEAGAPAVISGVTVRKIDAPRGMLGVEDLDGIPWPDDPHFTRTRLVCLENTTNMGGGHAYPLEQMQSVSEWTRDHGLKRHLDGARFFNATVAAGYSPGKIGALFDSVTICFSKGLGAPMGAILAGSREDIHRARRVRKMLGGGCRQIGIIAASALYALDHHIDRLEKDHEKAKRFARGIAELEGISLLSPVPETNLVFFDIAPECGTAEEMKIRLERYGVQIGSSGKQRMRAVTHLDVSPDDITRAIDAVGKCVADTAPATEK